ncbi:MAG: hypothetical protein JJE45_04330 [Prolixibacteraceae bacterium]|nr:hypothetical protein [Prolixibacteraceae bacterium]
MKILFISIFFLFFFTECQSPVKNDKTPLAQVGYNILYKEDAQKVLPKYITESDSTLWMNDFINRWIRKELVVLAAEENLSSEQKDVSEKLNDYRNSLLIYRYKNQLLSQNLDTLITPEEINDYYNNHKKDYILTNNIIKSIFLKVPSELANIKQIKDMCKNLTTENLAKLDEYGMQYTKLYDRFDDQWINASSVFKLFPNPIKKESVFLEKNKYAEDSDTNYYYFICIRDYRLSGDIAPMDFVNKEIINVILNKRKIEFFQNMEDNIFQEGSISNKYKIFNKK